jgi:ABC-type spermidine/putrescine transport system permease subunit II
LFERVIKAFGALVVAFIGLPVLVVIPLSFSSAQFLAFPPPGYSLRWYQDVLSRDYWLAPAWTSVQVASVTAVVALVLGTLASISLVRGRYFGRTGIMAFVISPMIVPFIVTGIALYFVLSKMALVDTFVGLVIGHTVLAVPRVVVVMTAVLQRVDVYLEHAATTLGARPWQAFMLVTLPSIIPGVISAGVIAFLTSYDEIIVTLFLSGARITTLPKRMWDSLLTELTPGLAAISTLLLVALVVLFAVIHVGRNFDWSGMRKPVRAD